MTGKLGRAGYRCMGGGGGAWGIAWVFSLFWAGPGDIIIRWLPFENGHFMTCFVTYACHWIHKIPICKP